FLSESYNVNRFSQNSFEIIGEIVEDFVKDVESVEDIEKLDFLALRNKFLEKFEGIKNED
ncbi:MAG: GTP pyrophosphokinase, partial [Finegoldia magna]|nr:GTP pyrophosphokinase [Finegoldia magna]